MKCCDILSKITYRNKMRNCFIAFLMLLMVTPSLVCAMSFSSKETAAKMSPCPMHPNANIQIKNSTDKSKKIMLAIDCMGVNLYSVDTATIDNIDLKSVDKPLFVTFSIKSKIKKIIALSGASRGPPATWPSPAEMKIPTLYSTQRYRI